ncbi:exodeoxyribonuclease V subunit gamma [Flocculibacter collagenilyticus]|uniref:exodeoxyribonuclease V subunit gamma n=1 Tax=Flocculibacter collagenilyticus TaxID=2744479 RepID=UPI0018F44B79|nr:exodeoxyribonuclease V subunit gamma [Flocculibacter collagenilyticus]
MLSLVQSNKMEVLAEQLAQVIKTTPLANPFEPEVILVQSPGMSQWLKISLAEQLGIAANLHFPLPSSFIWTIYQALVPDLPEQSAFNKTDMAWKVFQLLEAYLVEPDFAPLKHYLSDDTDQIKLYQLSEKIADVFDQYLMYRPEWILGWEAGEDAISGGNVSEQPWQPMLWRAIIEKTKVLGQSPYHRTNLHNLLIERLANLDVASSELTFLPQRLFVFGISTLPRQQLDVLEHLAKHIDIYLFYFNPCQHYWGDIVNEKMLAKIKARYPNSKHNTAAIPHEEVENFFMVGNPLLASLGGVGKDYVETLLDIPGQDIDCFIESPAKNALETIQNDILNLSFRDQMEPLTAEQMLTDEGKQIWRNNDASILFNSAHSPVRELEILHDHLLNMMQQHPTLTPKDIIVMMPDVSQYGPYIESVFSSVPYEQYIPFAISDRGVRQENPILESFITLLKLPKLRFTASEILDLLQVPAILNKLELDAEDLPWIVKWVRESGVRWGIDERHRSDLGFEHDDLNTWQFGLKRALLGYASNEQTLYHNILPYTEIEGQQAVLLGKVSHFVNQLITFRKQLTQATSAEQHIAILRAIVEDFYLAEEQDLIAINTAREAISALAYHLELGNIPADEEFALSYEVVCEFIQSQLNEKGVGQRFLAGRVNFCTLMPMRSIPFKVVCLIGMNDGEYPRFVAPVGFDLMATSQAKKGDRSRRLEDRYLFLEALLSAREQLYISFNGRSILDNSIKVPSVVVSEFKEYIEQSFIDEHGNTPSALFVEHPLQPFNHAYFSLESHIKSYKVQWIVDNADALMVNTINNNSSSVTSTVLENNTLELDSLLTFWRHPIRYYFNHCLKVKIETQTAHEDDDEMFALLGLAKYQILNQRVKQKLLAESESYDTATISAKQYWRRAGQLPAGSAGDIDFGDIDTLSDEFVTRILSFVPDINQTEQIEISIILEGVKLQGWLQQFVGMGILLARPAKLKATDYINAWLQHIVCCAAYQPKHTFLIGLDKAVQFQAIDKETAQQHLTLWLAHCVLGHQQVIPFLSQTSFNWAKSHDESKLTTSLYGQDFLNIQGELHDPYVAKCYTEVNELPETFYQLADDLLLPMLENVMDAEEHQ